MFAESPMFDLQPPIANPPGAWALAAWMARTSRAVHPAFNADGVWQAALLFGHLFARREVLRDWHRAGDASLRDVLAHRPSLVSVVKRPYISTGWDASRRLRAIGEHYGAASGPAVGRRLEREAALPLAVVASRDLAVDIVLDTAPWFIHEGELCLSLFHGGERIYTLAFSLGFDAGEPVAFVGALQGLGKPHALSVYRALTAAFHGMRPRDMLIHAFRAVCRAFGLSRWLAVGDATRVSRSPYFGLAIPVCSSYDAAWAEHAGCLRPDGFHDMPVALPRRDAGDVPSRKRSSYRQRYEMLDRLERDLAQALRRGDEPPRAVAPVPSTTIGPRSRSPVTRGCP